MQHKWRVVVLRFGDQLQTAVFGVFLHERLLPLLRLHPVPVHWWPSMSLLGASRTTLGLNRPVAVVSGLAGFMAAHSFGLDEASIAATSVMVIAFAVILGLSTAASP